MMFGRRSCLLGGAAAAALSVIVLTTCLCSASSLHQHQQHHSHNHNHNHRSHNHHRRSSESDSDSVHAVLREDPIAAPVSPNMASFSFEVSGFAWMIGKHPAPVRSSFTQLFKNLQQKSKKMGPSVRIGGNTADTSWWNPNGLPRPANITYDITYADISAYDTFLNALDNKTSLVIDTNMRLSNSSVLAVDYLNVISQTLGWDRIRGVEIGNENDLFYENGIRAPNYTYDQYQEELRMYLQDIAAKTSLPPKKIQGGTFCCHWDEDIYKDIATFHDFFGTYSFHRYPTSRCHGTNPTLADLMSDKAAQGQAEMVAPYARHALSYGVPFVIGEGNSCSCGGLYNLSDTMASAVWSMDFLFNLAAVNVSMMNFHGGYDGPYAAIGYKNETTPVPDVHPLYYSMLAFTEATRNGATIQNISYESTTDFIKVWAVKDEDAMWRVVVISKVYESEDPAEVTISLGKLRDPGSGQLYWLRSKGQSLYDMYGLTWAGQTFDGSMDGTPLGQRTSTTLHTANNAFTFIISPAAIAVLEFNGAAH